MSQEEFYSIVTQLCKPKPKINKLITFADGVTGLLTIYKTKNKPKQLYWRIQYFGCLQSWRTGVVADNKLSRTIIHKLTLSDDLLTRYLRKKLGRAPKILDHTLYRDYYLNLLEAT